MSINQNAQITENISNVLKIQRSEGIPAKVMDSIQPVVIANHRKNSVVASHTISGVATETVMTLKDDEDFYLTDFIITSNVAGNLKLLAYINGLQVQLIIKKIKGSVAFNTMFPVKLDKGTSITLSENSSTSPSSVSIFGYYEQNF